MPLPLYLLGAAAISAIASSEMAQDRSKQQRNRRLRHSPKRLHELNRHESVVATYPSDFINASPEVEPSFGSVVCCGLAGLFEHTGIWVGDNTIVELDGNGLIKPISAERFLNERSGENLFVACNSAQQPLASTLAAERAIQQLFQYRHYDVFDNNCHNFIGQCFNPDEECITTFKTLNVKLAQRFDCQIYWDLVAPVNN